MSEITREEFSKIYNEQFVPRLKDLEIERAEVQRKTQPIGIITIVAFVICVIGFFIQNGYCIGIGFLVAVPCIIYASSLQQKIRVKLKKEIISKILSLYGNLYFSEKKDLISSRDIDNMGLFPRFATKYNDDIIVGIHKGCNFIINECKLEHTERRGKSSVTVTDFSGLLIKIQMNKKFSGKTIVGMKGDITKLRGYEAVELEDVDFMKNKKVYSTDQIEARYILTTSFMERLKALGNTFSQDRMSKHQYATPQEKQLADNAAKTVENIKNNQSWFGKLANSLLDYEIGVCAAFIDGYVYLFVPSGEDFFEIDISSTLYNKEKYYNVYVELQSILAIIDYLKLDTKLGL